MKMSGKRERIQAIGGFLSGMVLPNIGAFIAWGLITALFIPTGWIPNAHLAQLVGPMIKYLLPLLIGYTGGKAIAGERGGVIGTITTMGVIVGADIPMFLGAMVLGPLSGYIIRRFDKLVEGKVPVGFEMLVNNFSLGIIGMLLALLAYKGIGPVILEVNTLLMDGIQFMVKTGYLPLLSIVNEPAKVLFLNNAIEQGIYAPLGLQDSLANGGKSIFFMLETSPGPGLGILLAFWLFGKGASKESAPTAVIIHFLGGIHEIYFPYVLMKPIMIIPMIIGGMAGVITFMFFNAGLVAFPSPGSIFSYLAMTPRGGFTGTIAGVLVGAVVSFVIGSVLLKLSRGGEGDFASSRTKVQEMKRKGKEAFGAGRAASAQTIATLRDVPAIRKIVVACDAGMGSSAMGAGMLRKKVSEAGLSNLAVTNSAVNSLAGDEDLVITHRDLTDNACRVSPGAQHLSLTNFLDGRFYSELVTKLRSAHSPADSLGKGGPTAAAEDPALFSLTAEHIFLNLHATNKEEAIRFAGEQLVKGGYAESEYVEAMLEREKLTPTYLGYSIAVPHGTDAAKDRVLKTGIIFCQYPDGVKFGENEEDVAYLIIGIAAKNNEHIQVITQLTNALDHEERMARLIGAKNKRDVMDILNPGNEE
ncbi:PTS mannitol transporter subunit IICBA [Brenneria roseae]|uniref:PTS mannitol transporter subunit IICBA n=1 Tax=Brenneria roseae TaxID=1509241 RepID=UPI002490B852|nr:PTS mannitol transporter subunit IICBA [Brenneria roseae]